MIGACVLVFPLQGPAVLINPDCYEAEASSSLWDAQCIHYGYGVLSVADRATALRKILTQVASGKNWKRVGYEGSSQVAAPSWNTAEMLVPGEHSRQLLRTAFGGSELVDVSALLEEQRRRKTPHEIAKLRTAGEISALGLKTFERMVAVGISGVELAAEVERDIMVQGTGYNGATRVRAFAQVAVGPEESAVGYRPNEISTAHRLANGDVALLELGVVVDGYWADRTRVRVAGKPSDEQLKIYDVVRRAQEAAVAAIRPGVSGAEVDEAARSVIRAAGYGEFFPHVTGHGLGFRYHESAPILAPGSAAKLQEGELTSVEPGVYVKPSGGFRIEDDVLVTQNGFEVLGPFPKTLA